MRITCTSCNLRIFTNTVNILHLDDDINIYFLSDLTTPLPNYNDKNHFEMTPKLFRLLYDRAYKTKICPKCKKGRIQMHLLGRNGGHIYSEELECKNTGQKRLRNTTKVLDWMVGHHMV